MLHRNANINETHDLFLPCKIIMTSGGNEDEKNKFSLEIAKATNTQKPIKPVDLKANSPEQVRFAQAMREAGVFYQTKRGETPPAGFKAPSLNTDLMEVGKLCLAAIYQIPCASRAKPSTIYSDRYYVPVFDGNQAQVAKICKELLKSFGDKPQVVNIYYDDIEKVSYASSLLNKDLVVSTPRSLVKEHKLSIDAMANKASMASIITTVFPCEIFLFNN